MRRSLFLSFVLPAVAVAVVGCASRSSMPVYDRTQIGQVVSEQKGEVVSVRDVLIKGQTTQAGSTGAGARIGSAAVTGAILGAPERAVAAVVGSMAGSAAGARMDDRRGEEVTVMLEGGKTVVIVQEREAGVAPLAAGEKVRVQMGSSSGYGGGNSRVVRDDGYASDVIGAR
jgi:outer membrane lipoprotein SlyB